MTFLSLDFLDDFVDRLEFRDAELPERFFNRGDTAKLPAQTVWTASVLAQD